jgi:hypothetical protein
MNEQIGTAGGAGTDEAADLDDGTPMRAADAAVIMQDAGQKARQQLQVGHRATFTFWGLGLLLGYGAIWLTVRGQHPFHGPDPAAFATFTLLAVGAAIATVAGNRADSGVGGLSAARRRIHFLAVLAGLAAMFALEGALARAGASRGVLGVFEASAPVLVAGLFYLTTSAVWLDWPLFGLGIWLLMVSAVGGFAGPAGVWAVDALAAGLAYLLMAAIEPWVRRL